jgi:hypothetical protein
MTGRDHALPKLSRHIRDHVGESTRSHGRSEGRNRLLDLLARRFHLLWFPGLLEFASPAPDQNGERQRWSWSCQP